MRVTKKVIAAVLILCMMLQISGAAVIADDAANSRGIEISGPTVEKGGEPVHAADIVSVSVEGGKSVSPASGASASAGGESVSSVGGASTSAGGESVSSAGGASASAGGESVSSAGGASASAASAASAAGGDTFSAGSEESHAQSQGEQKSSADEGLTAEPSQTEPEAIKDRTELSNQANEGAVSDSRKTDDGTEALTGNGKAAGDEEAAGSEKAAKIEKAAGNKKAAKNEKAGGDEDADEDEKESGDEKESEDEKASEDEKESGDEEASRGNITAKDAGIVLEGAGEFDILVTGTLKSEGTPILIDKSVEPDNVSITVWKIEDPVQAGGKNEKHVVLEGKLGEAQAVTDDSKKVEAGIRYIIKIEPSQEKLINLEGTEKSHGYNTAKEGETVTLKISVPDGYKLVGAYNGDGDKVPLKKDDHGNYYVVVPKAGGVYLSAEFEESSDKDDDDDEEDECSGRRTESVCSYADRSRDREECDLAGKCNRIIYDLNGGTLNGDKGPIIVQAERDKEYKLLDAPEKPGARFLRWASSCKDVRVSKPGEAFVFEHCVKFTAVWDDDSVGRCGRHKVRKDCDDDEDDEDDGDEDDEDTDENDDGPDVTETVRITEANDEELNINSIKVDDNPAVGIEIIAACDVDVDEDITVTGGDQGATGVKASAEGKSVTSEVETGSGMKVKSEGSSVGIEASASDGGSLSVDFDGSIDVSSGSGSSVGISAHADSGSSVSIEVG